MDYGLIRDTIYDIRYKRRKKTMSKYIVHTWKWKVIRPPEEEKKIPTKWLHAKTSYYLLHISPSYRDRDSHKDLILYPMNQNHISGDE